MFDNLDSLMHGFGVVLTFHHVAIIMGGVLLGILVGLVVLRHPVVSALLAVAVVAVVFTLLLNAGPPTEWGR